MGTRKVTLEQALEALAQNNIPFASGTLTIPGSRRAGIDVISSACALGQCAINLGVDPGATETALRKIIIQKQGSLGSWIVSLNDTYKYSPDKVAKTVREALTPEQLETVFELPTVFSITELKGS
jgi:hypothetical protein